MVDPTPPAVLDELVSFINRVPPMPKDAWRRMRMAVTTDEYIQLREFFFKDSGKFYNMVRGVPLQVEEHPHNPLLTLQVP